MTERRVALVTGASGAIGGQCAKALAAGGFAVAVHFNAGAERARTIVDEIVAAGGEAWAIGFDMGEPQEIERGIRELVKQHGRLDALVCAAGVVLNQMLAFTTAENMDEVYRINLRGSYFSAKAAAKAMIRQQGGRIVFVSSIVAERGNAGQSAYASVKAGLIGMGKSIARELAPRNITVNVVAPGFIESPMTSDLTAAQRSAILQEIPLRRTGMPEDVAALVAFLCSDSAAYITGAVLPVDGGLGI